MTIKSNELSIELELLKRKLNGVRAWNWDREFCGWKQLCSTTNSSGLIFLILFQVEIFFLLLFVVVALFSVYSSPEMDDKIHSFRNAKCLFRVYAFQFTFQDWYGTHTLAMRRRTVSEFVHVIRGSKHNIKLLTVSLPHNCVYFFFVVVSVSVWTLNRLQVLFTWYYLFRNSLFLSIDLFQIEFHQQQKKLKA